MVFELDPADGRVLRQWSIEGFEPHGLTIDPTGRIWICDAVTNRIGIVNAESTTTPSTRHFVHQVVSTTTSPVFWMAQLK